MVRTKLFALRFRILLGLLLVTLAAWLALRGLPDDRLHVYFLDVGQGDAILLRAPDGRQVLVDGGPSPAALLDELGALMPFWDRSLDLVVLTHPDADHMTGLLTLPERYRVAALLIPDGAAAYPASWADALADDRGELTVAQRGMQIKLDTLQITVLHAPDSTAADDNNASLVLRLDYGTTSLLLTGDAEQMTEQALLDAGAPLRADVLKVAHHGSASSTTAAFLAAVQPRLAVIQVGADNRFGHPHPDVLARLAAVEVLRTDLNGRIEVISDGERLWMHTER